MKAGALERVLVRPPHADDIPSWRQLGWHAEPDAAGLAAEHDALCAILEDAGAEVVRADGKRGSLDAIYAFDPLLLTDAGALLLRPGKPERRDEPEALLPDLERAGVPVAGSVAEPALVEGGDTLWLDDRTLVVGRSYRTNAAGIEALRTALPGVDVIAVDLPHLNGRGEVLHLLSLLSPLDDDLVVGYPPLMPVPLVELLEERGIEIVVSTAALDARGVPLRDAQEAASHPDPRTTMRAGAWQPGPACYLHRRRLHRRRRPVTRRLASASPGGQPSGEAAPAADLSTSPP